jgi:Protein of unknown function (DUF3606)
MSDDEKCRGAQDRARINLSEQHEVRYWTRASAWVPVERRERQRITTRCYDGPAVFEARLKDFPTLGAQEAYFRRGELTGEPAPAPARCPHLQLSEGGEPGAGHPLLPHHPPDKAPRGMNSPAPHPLFGQRSRGLEVVRQPKEPVQINAARSGLEWQSVFVCRHQL